MKKNKIIALLLVPAFFFGSSKKDKPGNSDAPSGYEVRFTYTGYLSFYGAQRDCPVGAGGKVELTGILWGNENVGLHDDVDYLGTLDLDINIAICSAKRQPNGEDAWCSTTVKGKGPVKVSLEIYADQRGGYTKILDTTSKGFPKNVFGTCELEQTNDEREMVPLKSISSVFNGTELPILAVARRLGELQLNHPYEDPGETGKLVIEVLRKIQ